MKEKTIAFIKEVSEQAESFNENLKTHANAEFVIFEKIVEDRDENQVDDDEGDFTKQLELLGEKEGLDAVLEQFKEFMDAQITSKENTINKAIVTDQNTTEKHIIDGQHKRNRGIIKEIISTCTTFRQEIKQDFD